jgi:hypothetical protein
MTALDGGALTLPLKGREYWVSAYALQGKEMTGFTPEREGNYYAPPPSRGRLGGGWGICRVGLL